MSDLTTTAGAPPLNLQKHGLRTMLPGGGRIDGWLTVDGDASCFLFVNEQGQETRIALRQSTVAALMQLQSRLLATLPGSGGVR